MKYLYGASVQGIQNFIFETNKLKEISGASAIIDYICTDFFREIVEINSAFQDKNLLIGAAGNIKYVFDDYKSCEALVQNFPRKVMNLAPGIIISQAVTEIVGDFTSEHLQTIESRLKTQRNKPIVQHGLGMMISERSRRTGITGIDWENNEVIDNRQKAKRAFKGKAKKSLLEKFIQDTKGNGYHNLFPEDMEELIGGKGKNNWIAVIHADGNDLGKKIMKMTQDNIHAALFRDLSDRIGNATMNAARKAFHQVVITRTKENAKFPFRPIILGGDDITVIIRGDLALDYTHRFLEYFESETKSEFANFEGINFREGLTACAGIAYIKANYPFHYGVHLAESLCTEAKKKAKKLNVDRTPSCLLFHKVHSSFIEDYSSIVDQELTFNNGRLDFGPYFLTHQKEYATIETLNNWIKFLNEKASPKSRLRNWLTELQINTEASAQEMGRIKRITDQRYVRNLDLDTPFTNRGDTMHTHLFDAIALSSIKNP